MARPPKFQLVEMKIDGRLEDFLAERRAAEESFDSIARAIWDATGVSVTGATVRNWCVDYVEVGEGAA